jgi:hypothetical protein
VSHSIQTSKSFHAPRKKGTHCTAHIKTIRIARTPKQGGRKKYCKQKDLFFLEKQFWGEMAMFAGYIVHSAYSWGKKECSDICRTASYI